MLACRVCARTLLPGELYRLFLERGSCEQVVCRLCEAEAVGRGWLELEQPARRVRVHDLARTVQRAA